MKKIISAFLAAIMAFCLFSCEKKDEATGAEPTDVAVKSENFSFNLAEATYCFNRYYIEFCNENAEYLTYYGIDKTKSLKDQEYTADSTWFEYFLDSAKAYLSELLLFCEEAKAKGYSLSDEDKKEIDDLIQLYIDEAEGNGYTIESFCNTMYGNIVTIDHIRTFVEKEKLAFKLYNDMIGSYTYTEAEQDKYLSENPDEFYYVNYDYFTFDESKDRDAAANAKELAETADAEAFYNYVADYEANVIKLDDESKVGVSDAKYVLKNGAVGDWAFSASVGDKFVDENAARGLYTVYMLTATPALQEYNVRNIRYICLTKGTYISNEKAKGKAEDILVEWDEGEKTAEAFGKLAERYSEDTATAGNGGICTNVDKTNSILNDEGIAWLFDEAQPGDVKLFKDTDIYYIVYLESIGDVQWRINADDMMSQVQYVKDMEAMEAAHNVEFLEDILQQIDE